MAEPLSVTREGTREEGVSRDLLFLKRNAVDVVRHHKSQFVAIVKDVVEHVSSGSDPFSLTEEELRRRRRRMENLFGQVCERLGLEYFQVSAKQVTVPEEWFLKMEREVTCWIVTRLLSEHVWVKTKRNGGDIAVAQLPGQFRYLVEKCCKADEVESLRSLTMINYMLELLTQVHMRDEPGEETFWLLYSKFKEIHLGEMMYLRRLWRRRSVECDVENISGDETLPD